MIAKRTSDSSIIFSYNSFETNERERELFHDYQKTLDSSAIFFLNFFETNVGEFHDCKNNIRFISKFFSNFFLKQMIENYQYFMIAKLKEHQIHQQFFFLNFLKQLNEGEFH